MYIQCFIKKADGSPVFVDYEGVRYIFQRNEFGHAVCFVGNQGHVRRLMKMGPACYQDYTAPEEATQASLLGGAPVPLGGQQKRASTNPLPQGLSVDDALTQPPGDINAPPPIQARTAPVTAISPNQVRSIPDFELSPAEQAKIMADRAATATAMAGEPDTEAKKAQTDDDKPEEEKAEKPDTTEAEEVATEKAAADAAIGAGQGTPEDVTWADEAVEAKVKEFKFLPKANFKTFVDNNREQVKGWPEAVKAEMAKKLTNLFPDKDPEIEGLNLDDYNRSGSPGNS